MALGDILDDIIDDLNDAKDIVADDEGPLPNPQRYDLGVLLDDADGHIDDALLEISNVGTEETGYLAATLPGIAADCHAIAHSTLKHLTPSPPELTDIGSKIKTIRWMMAMSTTDGYRDRAGLS